MNIAVAIVCLSRCSASSLMFGTEDCTVKSTDDFVLLSRFQASLVLSSMFVATQEGTAKLIDAYDS